MEGRSQTANIGRAFLISFVAFLIPFILSKIFGLMRNALCFKYLGCNAGFFGYDAMLHFLWGLSVAVGIVWICRRYERWNVLTDRPWKNVLLILSIAALIGVTWEILEFIYDHVRMDIFHINLTNPNQMAQASNSDTMGDLTFNLIGTYISVWVMKFKKII